MTTDQAAAGADRDDGDQQRTPQRSPTGGDDLNELARMALINGVLDDSRRFWRYWMLAYGSQVIVTIGRLSVGWGLVCAPGVGSLVMAGGYSWAEAVVLGTLVVMCAVVVMTLVLRRRQPRRGPATGGRGAANSGGRSNPRLAQPPKRRKRS